MISNIFVTDNLDFFPPKTVEAKSHEMSILPLLFTSLIFFCLYSVLNSNYHAKFPLKRVDFDLESAKWFLEPTSVPAKIWQS
jgi:hypothetical protein